MYSSEKIKQILTSSEGNKFLEYISPIYEESFTVLWILQAIGIEWDEISSWTDDFWKQINVLTATWALPYYEQEYGIPTDTTISTTQRRNTILTRIRAKTPMNPYRIATLAQAICGLPCRVEERTDINNYRIYVSALSPADIDEISLKKVLGRANPGYLIIDIKYEQGVQTNFYAAFFTQKSAIYTGRQVN